MSSGEFGILGLAQSPQLGISHRECVVHNQSVGDSNRTAGEKRLLEEIKLPLGGSRSGLPTRVKVGLQDRESYVTY